MSRVPTTAFPLSFADIAAGLPGLLFPGDAIPAFEKVFARMIGVKHAFVASSGTAAFYLVLKAFHDLTGKHEVVLPAYTVPTLTLAMDGAGLKTRLCDISRSTFNLDPERLPEVITNDTLCVVPVHMFGYPCAIEPIRRIVAQRDIFIFEDACQAPGARLNGRQVGSLGHAACFSLCKGKNFSTFNGGIATTDSDDIAERIRIERESLPASGCSFQIQVTMKLAALSLAMRPFFYGLLYPMIAPFKSTEVHTGFDPRRYTGLQARIGRRLLTRLEEVNHIRTENGKALVERLRAHSELLLPQVIESAEPVCNHLPVVFKNQEVLEEITSALWQKGIDTARMYERPIHRIYDLGYSEKPDPFPEATYVAERMITLPTHPYLSVAARNRILDVFADVLGRSQRV